MTNEPFINRELLERVYRVREDLLLHDDSFKPWERDMTVQEERDLSELARVVSNFTKAELAVAVIMAMETYPYMVLQVVAEYVEKIGGIGNE